MSKGEAKAALDVRHVRYRPNATREVLRNLLNEEVKKEQSASESKAKGTSIARFFARSPTSARRKR